MQPERGKIPSLSRLRSYKKVSWLRESRTHVYLLVVLLQKNNKVVSIDSYEDVPANNEAALQKAAASQPVSVAIEAGGWDFQLYESVSN